MNITNLGVYIIIYVSIYNCTYIHIPICIYSIHLKYTNNLSIIIIKI